MILVTELRAGTTFKLDNQPFQVVEYKHTKLGRGTANIRVKARNLLTGSVVSKTFISGAKVEPLITEAKELQYLYRDGETVYFMDPRNFEQFSLPLPVLGPKADFLKEGEEVRMLFGEDKPLSIELPVALVFEVIQAPPGVRGDSATASFKQATLDNGAVVKVPLFVNKGDRVKIDTRTGTYIKRIK